MEDQRQLEDVGNAIEQIKRKRVAQGYTGTGKKPKIKRKRDRKKTNENVLRKSSKMWTSEAGGARPAVTKNTKSLLLQRTPMG